MPDNKRLAALDDVADMTATIDDNDPPPIASPSLRTVARVFDGGTANAGRPVGVDTDRQNDRGPGGRPMRLGTSYVWRHWQRR